LSTEYQLGVDVGGTFTDFVATDGGEVFKGKVSSRPDDEASAVLEAIGVAAKHFELSRGQLLAATETIVLGTTVVTNTMLEYDGVPSALLTNDGFRDIIELRRGYKESLFDLHLEPPHAIVPRRYRRGIQGRIDYEGSEVTPLDEEQVRTAARELRDAGIQAIGVCFLFSFVNPSHELRTRDLILEEHPDCFVTLSCEVLPQIREFERVSTTAVNAYTSPKLRSYLQRLERTLRDEGFVGALLVMQSNGGVMDVGYSSGRGVDAVLSGPSGGVVAAVWAGRRSGYTNLITADMGGTSYDVCLIHDGRPEVGVDRWVGRYRIAVPLVDIHTIGSGGGSLAWVDEGGALRVGPESAGAYPGPACYGRGGERPTVTDANLLLGYIDPGRFLGSSMELDVDAAEAAMAEHVAAPLGISAMDAAIGVSRLTNNSMSNALRYVSVSRGRDPRDYALMAFGGAGAIHAGVQAVDLGMRTVLVPRSASVLSALGGLVSDFKVSKIRSFVCDQGSADLDALNAVFETMTRDAEEMLESASGARLDRYLDMRYHGQVQEVSVPLHSRTRRVTGVNLARALSDFHELHQQLYAFNRPEHPAQIVSLRVELTGARDIIAVEPQGFAEEDSEHARGRMREVFFEGSGFVDTPYYEGERLRPGNVVSGPAVIHEADTTIVVYPGQEAMLDQFETYVIEVVQ
jgi:N-methylhydantoinase A